MVCKALPSIEFRVSTFFQKNGSVWLYPTEEMVSTNYRKCRHLPPVFWNEKCPLPIFILDFGFCFAMVSLPGYIIMYVFYLHFLIFTLSQYIAEIESKDSEAGLLGFKSQLCMLQACVALAFISSSINGECQWHPPHSVGRIKWDGLI